MRGKPHHKKRHNIKNNNLTDNYKHVPHFKVYISLPNN